MFERYTEKARRVIFFARYEASQFGSPYIETEHLLLGLLREDREIFRRLQPAGISTESVRKRLEAETPVREKVSTSVDLPLSAGSKRVLSYAAEEAEALSNKHIGSEHLLLGLLREQECLAAKILQEHGIKLEGLRAKVRSGETAPPVSPRGVGHSPLSIVTRDLTEAASAKELDPLIGREEQLENVIRILCRRDRNNPLLLGEPEVGKTAIVHGLAHRLASGNVPPQLEGRRLWTLDLSPVTAVIRDAKQLEVRVFGILKEMAGVANLIIFLDDLFAKAGAPDWLNTAKLLKPLLTQGEIQCVATAAPAEYRRATQEERWLERCFNCVEVQPAREAEALEVLAGLKKKFEQFHNVLYTDEALRYAVLHSQRFLSGRYLPGKAIDLIDEAGAAVETGTGYRPDEVTEAEKRLNFLSQRVENAVGNHEFEKARVYYEEERQAREELRQLRLKYNLPERNSVTLEDIEKVVAQWTRLPLDTIKQSRTSSGPVT